MRHNFETMPTFILIEHEIEIDNLVGTNMEELEKQSSLLVLESYQSSKEQRGV